MSTMRNLTQSLAAIEASGVRPAQVWTHKRSGVLYVVVCVGVDEATFAPNVVYKLLDHDGTVWIRPLEEFCETPQNSGESVWRFFRS